MNLETKITIYKFTPQLFTLTQSILSVYYSVYLVLCLHMWYPHALKKDQELFKKDDDVFKKEQELF